MRKHTYQISVFTDQEASPEAADAIARDIAAQSDRFFRPGTQVVGGSVVSDRQTKLDRHFNRTVAALASVGLGAFVALEGTTSVVGDALGALGVPYGTAIGIGAGATICLVTAANYAFDWAAEPLKDMIRRLAEYVGADALPEASGWFQARAIAKEHRGIVVSQERAFMQALKTVLDRSGIPASVSGLRGLDSSRYR